MTNLCQASDYDLLMMNYVSIMAFILLYVVDDCKCKSFTFQNKSPSVFGTVYKLKVLHNT